MIKLKSADRVIVRTPLGYKEVKGEIYKGFGINECLTEKNKWALTCIEGECKGICITACNKKNDCRLLADEIIKKLNKTDLTNKDMPLILENIKKYAIVDEV